MGKRIETYPVDKTPDIDDKVVGSSSEAGKTYNYKIKEILALQNVRYVSILLSYKYASVSSDYDETVAGYFSANDDDLSLLTELKLNKISQTGANSTAYLRTIQNQIASATYEFNIKDSNNAPNYVRFLITNITEELQYFKVTGQIISGSSNGSFIDEDVFLFQDTKTSSSTAGGDMLQSVFATNGDVGKVDSAVDADTVNSLTVETSVPSGALFTDTDTHLNLQPGTDITIDKSDPLKPIISSSGDSYNDSWIYSEFDDRYTKDKVWSRVEHLGVSSGAPSASKPVQTNASGKIDGSFFPAGTLPTSTIDNYVNIEFSMDKNQKNVIDDVHGGLIELAKDQPLSTGVNVLVTGGISKLLFVPTAGTDVVGSVTFTGTQVDRNTGIETANYVDTVSINGLAVGSKLPEGADIIGAYMTNVWFKGAVTVATTNTNFSLVTVYQVAFEQFGDVSDLTIEAFDMTFKLSNTDAYMDSVMCVVLYDPVTEKTSVTNGAFLTLSVGDSLINKLYRIRKGNLGIEIDGANSGVFLDLGLYPDTQKYFESVTCKIWARHTQTVTVASAVSTVTGINVDNTDSQNPIVNGLTADESAAMTGSNSPSASNVMATIEDTTVIPYGKKLWTKGFGNSDLSILEIGDVIEGFWDATTLLKAVYNGGSTTLIGSYSILEQINL